MFWNELMLWNVSKNEVWIINEIIFLFYKIIQRFNPNYFQMNLVRNQVIMYNKAIIMSILINYIN